MGRLDATTNGKKGRGKNNYSTNKKRNGIVTDGVGEEEEPTTTRGKGIGTPGVDQEAQMIQGGGTYSD